MSSGRKKTYRISTPSQWRAISSPLRIDLIQHLRAAGPSTVAELANWLGKSPVSLYYHVRVLERIRILRACATRKGRRQTEALYDLAAQDFTYDVSELAGARNIQGVCAAILRMTQRDLRRSVAGGDFSALIEDGLAAAGRRTCWLTPAELSRVMRRLAEIKAIGDRSGPRPTTKRYSCTIFVLPLGNRENNK